MTANKQAPKSSLFPVIFAAFIDMLGVGIIIPVLAPLIISNSTGILDPATTEADRYMIFGILLAVYPFLQFFGAPILGTLSDRFGRKPTLSIALIGSAVGYAVFAYGIMTQNLILLFVGRAVDGFTGGNISIVFASIADLSDSSTKAKNFGLVGMMFGLGFILGPMIGGVLANPEMVSWFNPTVPFWFAAILCMVNMLLVQLLFKETLHHRRTVRIDPLMGFRNMSKAFKYPNLRTLFIVVFFLTLGFAFFTQFFAVYLIDKFQYDEQQIGWLFGWIGLWIAITQGAVIGPIIKRWSSGQILQVTILCLAIALPLILVPSVEWLLFALCPLIAISQGLTGPNMNTLVSEQASPDQQGEILGINQSIASIGLAIPPLASGFLSNIGPNLPTLTASGFVLVSWLVYMFVFKGKGEPKSKSHS